MFFVWFVKVCCNACCHSCFILIWFYIKFAQKFNFNSASFILNIEFLSRLLNDITIKIKRAANLICFTFIMFSSHTCLTLCEIDLSLDVKYKWIVVVLLLSLYYTFNRSDTSNSSFTDFTHERIHQGKTHIFLNEAFL